MDIMIALVLFAAVTALFAWKKGFFKNTEGKPSAPPVKPMPVPDSNDLAVSYTSEEALRAFIKRTGFSTAIKLDGESINLGFGPAVEFTTQIDGSVSR